MPADLHTHSRASDGVDRPFAVVRVAAAAGLNVLALTDHDTTAGWDEAAEEAHALGMLLVPGTEISCLYGDITVHLLSYLHDPEEPDLRGTLRATREDRNTRARRMVDLLAADTGLTWAEVEAQVASGAAVGRPHIADALIARGLVGSRDEAFATLLHRTSRYYVPHGAPQVGDALQMVLRAGGVPVLAHPLAAQRGRVLPEEAIGELARAGLRGIEADHPDHTPEQRDRVRRLAAEHELFWTGSSDYHGAARHYRIGECTTPDAAVEAVLAAGRGSAAST
jgi:3',5'-nucleoside bisphosphate phosphatase